MGGGTPKHTAHCRQQEWDNNVTVNRGQGADKTVRDQAAEASLSVDGPSNSTVCEAQLRHRLVGH